ncbi:hypothetical protein [Hyphomicrobium sp.]|uniref:hypothetical protein n=1 Tax=Hyphomicrobium sp. TaxID=82 RepID=UPI000FBA74D7|nr:hypothetical protein [Hyphomicrobium sp.]RUP10309.1 MAG: hypothetical protein EKK38_07755 [Hyphomicrobium sp.]
MTSYANSKSKSFAETGKSELAAAARTLGVRTARRFFILEKNPEAAVRRLRSWCKSKSFTGDAVVGFVTEWEKLTRSWTAEVLDEQRKWHAADVTRLPLTTSRL